ncbi:MAG: ATP-binding protein [Alphaproteobacteria bacterium]|nr:ATP-binding protein [Alphaproteobacteria bacterium]
MEEYYKPRVDEIQEFIEIAHDFSNPLEIVREAISNSFDAGAKNIGISFAMENKDGDNLLKIILEDDGCGMGRKELEAFFNLGDSTKREDEACIGEKGHGTKVYFNSSRVEVFTRKGEECLYARMDLPFKKLYNREIPQVLIREEDSSTCLKGTKIIVWGYNNNQREKFRHSLLKDYIFWFTKFGSMEKEFGITENCDVKLHLKGLDKTEEEVLDFGHVFPDDTKNLNKLWEEYDVYAPDYYCRKIVKSGCLENAPEITYNAIFVIEGKKVKYKYNDMLRRSGYAAPFGAYTVQERYGLWLCKDFIPVQRKNEWVVNKGNEYTRLHAFFNCQGLKLTANRGSVENTPHDILKDIKTEVKKTFESILESDDWRNIDWLSEQVDGYKTVTKENKDFKWRVEKVNDSRICSYNDIVLTEPNQESGVLALFMQIDMLNRDLFPFTIIDYNTHEGIDVIVKSKNQNSISDSKLFYVEFKHILKHKFNHSFENLHSIVCWDTKLKHDEILKDINDEERRFCIIKDGDKKKYFLDNPKKARKIEVIVLKDFLKDNLGLEFRPRTEADCYSL